MPPVVNALSVDVEDYFMVSAFDDVIRRDQWDRLPSRVERNTRRVLRILDRHGVRSTFFVLGYVGRRFPGLVREIHKAGHEIGCHGMCHRLVYGMTPDEMREDTAQAKGILEDVTGEPVLGFRAPSFSITARSMWALDVLLELGFTYDSSIYPIRHDRYGYPLFSRFPVAVRGSGGGRIIEVPMPTIRVWGTNIPCAGGGYLRIFPPSFTLAAIRRLNQTEEKPAVIYFHPWEVDPDQPRIRGRLASRLRHYWNIDKTEGILDTILDAFSFQQMRLLADRTPDDEHAVEAVRP